MNDIWTRRDLMQSLLGLAGAGMLPACSKTFRNEVSSIGGRLLGPDVETGHRLRDTDVDGLLRAQPAVQHRAQVAVIGAGPAGLTAAWHLARSGVRNLKILDLEGAPGGTSVAGSSHTARYPWGAHYIPVPMPHNKPLRALLDSMGVLDGEDEQGTPRGAETALVRDPEERLFLHGYWQPGLFPSVGASQEDFKQLQQLRGIIDRYVALRDGLGRRAFAIPLSSASDDATLVALERQSATRFLARHGITSKRVRWFCDYACRDDYGLSLADTSAWALIFYFAARTMSPGADTMPRLAWPEGNGAIVEHLMKPLHDCWMGGRLAVDVHAGSGQKESVEIRLWNARNAQAELLVADEVVVAVPRFVANRIVRTLRDEKSRDSFSYGPWLVANLHLNDRPVEWGSAPAWDNVLYDSPSLGYVSATHQESRFRGPTVWTYYYPLTDADPSEGRNRLLAADWDLWKDVIMRDLSRAHDNLPALTTRLDIWRWGHGMVQPRPGHVFSAARKAARQSHGRVHFAHSDLSGVALFEEAFDHGLRAAQQVLRNLRGADTETVVENG